MTKIHYLKDGKNFCNMVSVFYSSENSRDITLVTCKVCKVKYDSKQRKLKEIECNKNILRRREK